VRVKEIIFKLAIYFTKLILMNVFFSKRKTDVKNNYAVAEKEGKSEKFIKIFQSTTKHFFSYKGQNKIIRNFQQI
jgi:hypothetical protein